jgi:SPX domain protein involved in polyphosphate accumulation
MKFAKILRSDSVPEWRQKYIDYKGLKRLLKSLKPVEQETTQTNENLDTNPPTEVSITVSQPNAAQKLKRRPTLVNKMSRSFSNVKNIHSRGDLYFLFVKKRKNYSNIYQ